MKRTIFRRIAKFTRSALGRVWQSIKDTPWVWLTALASVFLFLAAVKAGKVEGGGLLVVFDTTVDILVIMAIARYAKDPEPDSPNAVPLTEERRKAVVSLAGLATIVGITLVSIIRECHDSANLMAHTKSISKLPMVFPNNVGQGLCVVGFSLCALASFAFAHQMAARRQHSELVPPATKTALEGNLTTGSWCFSQQLICLLLLFWKCRLDSKSAESLGYVMPLIQNCLALGFSACIAYIIIRKSCAEMPETFAEASGRLADPNQVERLLANLKAVPAISEVRNLQVVELTAVRAEVLGEVVVRKQSDLPRVEQAIDSNLVDYAELWRQYKGVAGTKHHAHSRLRLYIGDRPACGVARYVSQLGAFVSADNRRILPLHHEGEVGQVENSCSDFLTDEGYSLTKSEVIRVQPLTEGWDVAAEKQAARWIEVKRSLAKSSRRLAYFGLAEIPLTVHLGYCIGDGYEVDIYQRNRDTGSYVLPLEAPLRPDQVSRKSCNDKAMVKGTNHIAVAVEISEEIPSSYISEVLPSVIGEYRISVPKPSRTGVIVCRQQIRTIGVQFRETLDAIRKTFRDVPTEIHLFCAVPPGVAFNLGRQISRNMDSVIHIYYFSEMHRPRYTRAITLP